MGKIFGLQQPTQSDQIKQKHKCSAVKLCWFYIIAIIEFIKAQSSEFWEVKSSMSVMSGCNRQAWSVVSVSGVCQYVCTPKKTFCKSFIFKHKDKISFSFVLLALFTFCIYLFIHCTEQPWTAFFKKPSSFFYYHSKSQGIKDGLVHHNDKTGYSDWGISENTELQAPAAVLLNYWGVKTEILRHSVRIYRAWVCCVSLRRSCQQQPLHAVLLFLIYSRLYLLQAAARKVI